MNELEIEAEGRVQGVGLRQMVKGKADSLNLGGLVYNRESGEVLIVAQGEKKRLNEFLEWVQNSPGFSKIESLKYSWHSVAKKHANFKIVHEKDFVSEQLRNLFNLGKNIIGIGAGKMPIHIAIIPDGNRRWAKKKGLAGSYGHYRAGNYESIRALIKEAEREGVKYITFWGFSTENWKRDKKEINAIFELLAKDIELFRKDSVKNKIKFRHLGRRDRLPEKLRVELEKLEEETQSNKGIQANLCLDYGGRDEIINAVNNILKERVKKIDEKKFGQYLYSEKMPDPDLIIRTSGEQRTSGFMPFQSVYAELYFAKVNFPDFDSKELRKAIDEYKRRKRRFGG